MLNHDTSLDKNVAVREAQNFKSSQKFLALLYRHHSSPPVHHHSSLLVEVAKDDPVDDELPGNSPPLDNCEIEQAWCVLTKTAIPEVYSRVHLIQKAVANEFNITRLNMVSARKTNDIVLPRQVAMYLCRELTVRSYPDIGRRFGNKDHTTIIHAVRKITRLIDADPVLAARIERIKGLIAPDEVPA